MQWFICPQCGETNLVQATQCSHCKLKEPKANAMLGKKIEKMLYTKDQDSIAKAGEWLKVYMFQLINKTELMITTAVLLFVLAIHGIYILQLETSLRYTDMFIVFYQVVVITLILNLILQWLFGYSLAKHLLQKNSPDIQHIHQIESNVPNSLLISIFSYRIAESCTRLKHRQYKKLTEEMIKRHIEFAAQ
ncbi:hypothetical protein [Catenovulum sediminis]|uniref:hypothetical protein n=1 Tax=Catenovulum sediminis TaxID=1740262 RepID=UPI00117D41EA|nr:hypothetical protein [Catenovulum sediminis]